MAAYIPPTHRRPMVIMEERGSRGNSRSRDPFTLFSGSLPASLSAGFVAQCHHWVLGLLWPVCSHAETWVLPRGGHVLPFNRSFLSVSPLPACRNLQSMCGACLFSTSYLNQSPISKPTQITPLALCSPSLVIAPCLQPAKIHLSIDLVSRR